MVALLNYMDRQMLSTMKVAMMGDIRHTLIVPVWLEILCGACN